MGKNPFEVQRNVSEDCSFCHFSVILYQASNLKAQFPFERLILIFFPLLIPFSPLVAIFNLIQLPMWCNQIIWHLPLNYKREIYAEMCYNIKTAFVLQKLKDPLIWGTALEILPAHTPKDLTANWRQLSVSDYSSHLGCRWVELSWWVCLRGCQHVADTCRGLEAGEQIFVQRLVQWVVLRIPIWSGFRQKKGHQVYGAWWIQRLTRYWASQPHQDLWEHGLSFLSLLLAYLARSGFPSVLETVTLNPEDCSAESRSRW